MVAEDVSVEKFRYIDKLKTHKSELLQMSSKISGRLPEDFRTNLGNIILTLLPAGSVSGAPKRKTLEIIEKVENYSRNYYTGIFGYFDGKNLDSAVMIRFIENKNGELFFKSGGGITSMSEAKKEYDELIQKIYVPIT
jgi:para-aminobenzoate synthetase component 1